MKLTDKSVEELREILQEDSHTDVTHEQARKFGKWILLLYSHLAPPKPKPAANNNDK